MTGRRTRRRKRWLEEEEEEEEEADSRMESIFGQRGRGR